MTDPAKTEMMRRIHDAIGPSPAAVTVPRDYVITSGASTAEVTALFAERVAEYQATVTRTTADGVPAVISALLADVGTVVVPHDLTPTWVPEDLRTLADSAEAPLTIDQLDGAGAVITGSAVGIAQTGTVVLDAGPGQGRRAITLVPDVHVCVVFANQLVSTVPEGVRQLDATRPQTWISGPSATSDIELDRVEGVHGPRTLHVVLVDTIL